MGRNKLVGYRNHERQRKAERNSRALDVENVYICKVKNLNYYGKEIILHH